MQANLSKAKRISTRRFQLMVMTITLLLMACCLGCGGGGGGTGSVGGGGDGTVTITGTVDAALTTEGLSAADRSLSRASMGRRGVDQVWAVPLLVDGFGRFDPSMFNVANKKVFELENGHFTITFESGVNTDDWVLLLVNADAADRSDTIVSYVAVSDLNERLVKIPVGQMEGSLDLGNLTEDDEADDEAVAETNLEDLASVCDLSYGELQHMAKTDDLVKTIRNVWVNTNTNEGGQTTAYYQSSVLHRWHQDIADAENQFSNAAEQYKGYGIEIYFQDDRISWSDLIDPNTDTVNFTPPADVAITSFLSNTPSTTYGTGNPIVSRGPYNSNVSDGWDNDLGYCAWKNSYDIIRLQYASTIAHTWDGFSGGIPAGDWLLTDQNQTETYATFDFSMESPFNSDGTTKIYIPAIKITTDAEDEISAVNIQWMLYDKSTEDYEVVGNADRFWDLASEVRMDLNCQTGDMWGSGWTNINVDLLTNETVEYTPTERVFLNRKTESGKNLVWLSLRYNFNGAQFVHNWATSITN